MQLRAPVARPVDVLIASTHEWTSRSLASILAPQGYVFYRAYNRAQTLKRIRSNPPDAIIVDEQLPDGDGYTLCRELNEENLVSPSTPVFLALPRSPTRRNRLAALQASAWVCLGDPLDAEELTAMLEVFVPAKIEADQARVRGLVDDVTGVYNLRGLTRRAEELAAQASRRHSALCCVLLRPEIERDADGGWGSKSPDPQPWLLRRMATALRAAARHSDAIGRPDMSSFAVVAIDTDASQAQPLAERLAAAIVAAPTTLSVPRVPRLRVRAGWHCISEVHATPPTPLDVAALIHQASVALERTPSFI